MAVQKIDEARCRGLVSTSADGAFASSAPDLLNLYVVIFRLATKLFQVSKNYLLTNTLLMETEKLSEILIFNLTLTRLNPETI